MTFTNMYIRVVFLLGFLRNTVNCLGLDSFYKYVNDNSSNNTIECEKQKSAFLQGLVKGDPWATKMLDAYGRIPQAMTQGNDMDLGMFDQCLAIQENLNTTVIKGKYCYAGLVIPVVDMENNVLQMDVIIKNRTDRLLKTMRIESEGGNSSFSNVLLLAACVPHACLPSDLFGVFGTDSFCQVKNESRNLDASDIASIGFLVVIILLITLSTAYDVYTQKKSAKPIYPILLAFSIYTNGKRIFNTSQQSNQILFFNGMKVLSMFWVITAHRYTSFELMVLNKMDILTWAGKLYSFYMMSAPLSVDTFLFISGALLANTFLKTMRKSDQKFNIGLYYLHRYLRLTPALVALYFVSVTLSRRILDGPMVPLLMGQLRENCVNDNWWSFFLYIQNYISPESMCLTYTWYLSIDMQLYIISPLLLLPLHYYRKRIVHICTVLLTLTLISIIYTIFLFYVYNINYFSYEYEILFYYATHTRCPPWLIGLVFGIFLWDYQTNKTKYQITSKIIILIGWGVVFAVMAFLFFFQHDVFNNPTRIKSSIFLPLQKPIWALCLCWISFACLTGNDGFINSFLSLPTFQILAKVTYSTYLVHYVILIMDVASYRNPPYFSDYNAIRAAVADISISYAIGALWSLAFESPVLVIENVIFGSSRPKSVLGEIERNDNNATVKRNYEE